jgi:hypothetical protein
VPRDVAERRARMPAGTQAILLAVEGERPT